MNQHENGPQQPAGPDPATAAGSRGAPADDSSQTVPIPPVGPAQQHPPPQHPGYPDQPAGTSQPGRSTGGGKVVAVFVAVLVLMGASALGGGVVGAWIAQGQDSGAPNVPGNTTVVDGPRLDYASLAGIASQVAPGVVSIQAGQGEGSGVVISDDGYIVTNAHVVAAARGDQVRVQFSDGQVSPATIVGSDRRSDLAVVQAQDVAGLNPATFGNSDEMLVGDTVLAIGSPLGLQGSVTQGIISALNRTLPVDPETSLSGMLQTDASINPGNSGGALVNLEGQVIGINTAIATNGQPDSGFLGVGFAIPGNRAEQVAEQLIAGEEISHPFLGVRVGTAEGGGAVIADVSPGSPAEQAGLREGDVVVRLGDRTIRDSDDLVSAVQSSAVGEPLDVEYQRGGATETTTVTLAEREDQPAD